MMGTEAAAKPSQTYDLGPVEQIPIGEGRLLRIGHVPVAVFRARDGSVPATHGWAAALGGSPGRRRTIGEEAFQCSLQGYAQYELDLGKALVMAFPFRY